MEGEGVVESEEERGGVGSGGGGGNGGQLWGVMEGGEQWRERSNRGRGAMEGGAMMEGGGMMEGEGGGALELTHLGSSLHSFRRCPWGVVVSKGARCSWGIIVMGGHHHCLLVGHHPRGLEGCARGGACCLSWFQRNGLRVVVSICMGGGLLLPMGACRSWDRGWGIVVVGRVSPSMGGSLSVGLLLSMCACGRCWWWRSSPVVAVEQWWWWLPFVVVVVINQLWLSLSSGGHCR